MAIAGAITFAVAQHQESAMFDGDSRINFKEMK
jgi:hypothetical protein